MGFESGMSVMVRAGFSWVGCRCVGVCGLMEHEPVLYVRYANKLTHLLRSY